jgi:hypothetical protein
VFCGDLISYSFVAVRSIGDSTLADLDDGRIGLRARVRPADGTVCLSCFRLMRTPSGGAVPGVGCAGVGVAGRRRPPDRCSSPHAYEADCRSADAATCATTAHRLIR